MTPDEAAVLAARTLAAIDTQTRSRPFHNLNRERVASDLAGLRRHLPPLCLACANHDCIDRAAYIDGLRRTAALYGVTA